MAKADRSGTGSEPDAQGTTAAEQPAEDVAEQPAEQPAETTTVLPPVPTAPAEALPPAPAEVSPPAPAQSYPPQAYPPPAYPPPAQPQQASQQQYPQQYQQQYPQQAWRPQLPTYGGWEDAHGAPSSGAVRRAFAGVTGGDVVRDALAALLLLVGLTLPWDFGYDGLGRLEVVVITALSLVSLLAAYLARAGAYGDRLDARRAGLVRFALNVPYLLMVLGFLVGDAFVGDQPEMVGGIGAGLGVGLAGAVLAMAPRVAELGGGRNPVDRAWLTVLGVVGGVAVVWVLAGLLVFVIGDDADFYTSAELLRVLLTVLLGPAVLVLGVVGALRRDEGWRLALVAVGATPVLLYLVAEAGAAPGMLVESVHLLPGGLVFWPAAAAAAAAPSARRAMRVTRARWADAAGRVLTLAIVAAAVAVLVRVLTIADTEEEVLWIVLAVLALAYLGAAIEARVLVREGRRVSAAVAFGAAGALFLLGIIGVLVLLGSEWSGVMEIDLLLALGLPAAFTGVVLAHLSQDARGALGHPAVPEPPAPPAWAAPPAAPAAAPAPGAPDPVADAVRQAQDPATPQATLADLATRVPATRVHIARHPAAYPDLLDWLAALGDPEVSRAVAERRGY